MADLFTQSEAGHIAIIGFPFDEGTKRNNGRGGSVAGPATFRKFVGKVGPVINPEHRVDLRSLKLSDAGDVTGPAPEDIETAHQLLTSKVSAVLAANAIPFVVGGSNDQSFPNASALLQHRGGNIGVINIDAHLDVRPLKDGKAHSGSPFRQLLDDPRFCGKFVEFAAQGMQCSAAHADYVLTHGHEIQWLSAVQEMPLSRVTSPLPWVVELTPVAANFQRVLERMNSCDAIFVSFDIDSIQGSDCPGVSCPGVTGITANDALQIAALAGAHPNVQLMDLSEFNPAVEDWRTGRLTAFIFYHFCLGYMSRGQSL
eukprot:GILK01005031.1.p1 GENE.GILK01005031.1~~GILK01005031.1.p1  ORF type:complete len:336 (-),score=49.40 GILK01005031.1:256-1197(-)